MVGVLILAQKKKKKETEETLNKITNSVKKELDIDNVEPAFLKFSERNLEKGLIRLINKGVKKIKVIPYFLFEGVHIKEDIPREINNLLKHYPDVEVSFGRTLDVDERLAKIIADRVRELI